MNNIKYIGFYDLNELNQNRNAQVSAINKMNYIIDTLNNNKYSVTVVSPSWSKGNRISKAIKYKKNGNIYIMPFSLNNMVLFRFFNHLYCLMWLFIYLFFYCKKDEQIIVYHSLYIMRVISAIKRIKKIKVILEVEEVYSDVLKKNKSFRNKELKYINDADKYIFASRTLEETINENNKKNCIINGTYKVEPQIVEKYNDGKIHLVYSGILDYSKGAFNAIKLSDYLNDNYMIHIIGYGDNNIIDELTMTIEERNKTNKCLIVFDGIKKEKEYIEYIQKCDIGLSVQDKDASYNMTSFPSKILSYLSNGLRVVSVDIPAIKNSDIGKLLFFYEENNIKSISDVIKNISFKDKYSSREFIKKLDKKTTKEIGELL